MVGIRTALYLPVIARLDGTLRIEPDRLRRIREVTAGQHEVKVECYERGGGAVAQVSW